MRNRQSFILMLLVSVVLATTLSAAPRYRERRSTDNLERVKVHGKIVGIEGRQATLKTDSGSRVTVHLGPQWYWRERGYRLNTGTYVDVGGYGEVGDDEGGYVYPYEIQGEDFYIDLADENGYPRWAPDDEYYDDWNPTTAYYENYYYCPPPPPPPRPYWHGRHGGHSRYGYAWTPRGGWRWRPCRPHFGVHVGFWWP